MIACRQGPCRVRETQPGGRVVNAAVVKAIALVLALFVAPVTAGAQPAQPYRIGVLFPEAVNQTTLGALRQGLSDLGIVEPTKFDLAVNLETAKRLSLTMPPALLLRASQVIE